jgi:hypothetical protein
LSSSITCCCNSASVFIVISSFWIIGLSLPAPSNVRPSYP